jgi:hypothetical protein
VRRSHHRYDAESDSKFSDDSVSEFKCWMVSTRVIAMPVAYNVFP